jgi:hypothetical protein
MVMDNKDDQDQDEDDEADSVAWHPAFFQAIQQELVDYKDDLQFIAEHQLTSEPLRIDLLVIKNEQNIVIDKNIGHIFRGHNVVEYKSPTDHVSVEDFKKVLGYAYLYMSQNKVPESDMTLTFVESRHPRKLLEYLKKEGYTIDPSTPGIYLVKGHKLPIQIINSRGLKESENFWFKNLLNTLSAQQCQRVLKKSVKLSAYADVIIRGNPEAIKEMMQMSKEAFNKLMEESGLAAEWEAKGKAEGIAEGEARGKAEGEAKVKEEAARKAFKLGVPLETIAPMFGMVIDAALAFVH